MEFALLGLVMHMTSSKHFCLSEILKLTARSQVIERHLKKRMIRVMSTKAVYTNRFVTLCFPVLGANPMLGKGS